MEFCSFARYNCLGATKYIHWSRSFCSGNLKSYLFLQQISIVHLICAMKRGRKFIVPLEEQKSVFLQYKKYFSSKSDIPASTDPLYNEISTALANKITKQALYLSVKKNFDYFFNIPNKNDSNICCEIPSPTILTDIQVEKKIKINDKFPGNTVTYDFMIDTYQWERLQPITKRIKFNKGPETVFRMKNLLPKHQWAYQLREKIWEVHPIAHSWIFKQYSISMNTNITCIGFCKQCEADVKVIISWPSDKIAQCKCIITNYDENFIHVPIRKIKLSPAKRTEIAEELKHVSAVTYRNSMANNLVNNPIDPEPAHLPTIGSLRQIKHEQKKSLHFHQNQILSLWLMTQISPYKEAIKHISVYPFYIYYWDPCQDVYCKEFKKTDKLIVSIDATGSVFKAFGPTNNITITKHIFFYICVMKTFEGHSSVPLTQMLSENQSMDTICKWLEAWHVSNPKPDEIIVDESSALIGACVKAFTKHNSTKEYVQESFRKLEVNEKSDECYIRIDTSHFVKIIFNLSCFKHIDNRSKFFYIKCLLALKECINYENVKDILTDIITVCFNEHDGISKSTLSRCEMAKNRLKTLNQFQTLDTEIEIVDSDKINDLPKAPGKSVFESETDIKLSEQKSTTENVFFKWFTNKIQTEKLLVTLDTEGIGNHENLYYFPAFIQTLSRLLTLFPLWSNVMKNIYDSYIDTPTSSNVESYFKNIKRLLLQLSTKCHRLRTDEFIIKHLEFLRGEIKVAPMKSKLPNLTVQRENIPKKATKADPITSMQKRKLQPREQLTDDSIFAENPTFIENWKGKGKDPKKRKIPLKSVILLSNGSRMQINKKIIILRNTCAIDSVCQALAIAYNDGYRVSRTIHDSENLFCKFVRHMSGKDIEEVYKVRSEMAQVYFTKIDQESTVEVRCECNVNNIFERILIDCIYSADESEHCTESDCAINKVRRKIPVLHVNIDTTISELQESANSLINAQELIECRRSKCKGVKSFSLSLRDLIAFEFHSNEFISIDDPPISLLLEGSEFHLVSIIEFVPPLCGTLIGHYKAHCRRNSQWKCYDDESKKITKSKKKLIPHCLIYAKK